jgi:hypothetical protein
MGAGDIRGEDLRRVRLVMAWDIPLEELARRVGPTPQEWLDKEVSEELVSAGLFEDIMAALDRYDREQLN